MSRNYYYLWHCPACNRGLNNDHRQCLTKSYRFNGTAWENACLKAGAERAEKECLILSEASEYWLKRSNKNVILPPGTYYIGYAEFDHPRPKDAGCFTNGKSVFVLGRTGYNYRSFVGSNGSSYDVQEGLLGIFSVDIVRNINTGSFHTFTDMVEVRMDDPGVFKFVSTNLNLTIDTRHGDTL